MIKEKTGGKSKIRRGLKFTALGLFICIVSLFFGEPYWMLKTIAVLTIYFVIGYYYPRSGLVLHTKTSKAPEESQRKGNCLVCSEFWCNSLHYTFSTFNLLYIRF